MNHDQWTLVLILGATLFFIALASALVALWHRRTTLNALADDTDYLRPFTRRKTPEDILRHHGYASQ